MTGESLIGTRRAGFRPPALRPESIGAAVIRPQAHGICPIQSPAARLVTVNFTPAPTIRAATEADFPVIAALAGRIWRTCFGDLISPAQLEYMLAWRYTPEAMQAATADGAMRYLLAEVDGRPVGYAADGAGAAPREWKLHQLYVVPEQQGAGLGRALMAAVEERARRHGATTLVLTVNKRNERARRIYERAGFTVREAKVFDIGGGFVMDDYVMAKALTPA